MRVAAIRAAGSVGIAGYCDRLAAALDPLGVAYEPASAPRPGARSHYHLGNSSRRTLVQMLARREPVVVTVHDVVPRDRRLVAAHRAIVAPLLRRRATALVVHSEAAAGMLIALTGLGRERVRVIPIAAPRLAGASRGRARAALGWPEDEPVALLPGVLKSAKLVGEAASAATAAGWRLALAGRVRDADLVRRARAGGALVCADPDRPTYECAIAAADAVLVLRASSVGETNMPLLEALGAGRAVLATATGSIPEVAGGAALLCLPTTDGIRSGLHALADPVARSDWEARSAARAAELAPAAAARAHAELFGEVFGG
jgi:glycosyltransferase involved in cell wall biosynthesis